MGKGRETVKELRQKQVGGQHQKRDVNAIAKKRENWKVIIMRKRRLKREKNREWQSQGKDKPDSRGCMGRGCISSHGSMSRRVNDVCIVSGVMAYEK